MAGFAEFPVWGLGLGLGGFRGVPGLGVRVRGEEWRVSRSSRSGG
jgi:hypothetical protein